MATTERIITPCRLDIRRKCIDMFDANGKHLASIPPYERALADSVLCACNNFDDLVGIVQRYVESDSGIEDALTADAIAALKAAGVCPPPIGPRAGNGE